jgi:hypothetical protein
LYLLVEFLKGSLPWKGKEKDKIGHLKQTMTNPSLFAGLPSQLFLFYKHLLSLGYSERPDYDYLVSLGRDINEASLAGASLSGSGSVKCGVGMYDWEVSEDVGTFDDMGGGLLSDSMMAIGTSGVETMGLGLNMNGNGGNGGGAWTANSSSAIPIGGGRRGSFGGGGSMLTGALGSPPVPVYPDWGGRKSSGFVDRAEESAVGMAELEMGMEKLDIGVVCCCVMKSIPFFFLFTHICFTSRTLPRH